MTIKIRSEETCTESKFFYHNQDVTYNYHLDMVDNGINIWTSIHGKNAGLLPFVFQSFQISSEEDAISFYKYVKLIGTGCYVAILISGNLPYHSKRITKAMKLVGGGSKSIETLSDSNPNFCLIGYKGQKIGSARQAIGDADIEEEGGISVWMMTTKNRCLFKNRILINLRNKTPLGTISQLYKKHIKKEMTNNIYL
ncbi:hypothetical protein DDB_G0285347 [Dictyostelium discoideum AX4]|uniref:Putative uncharacterized transmembrane protein DDB_G0285347 n=1 Tax=Dictyostelium discoideum TaxID=44689 RepID=Y6453_DICDI|nr:hypothetical protein DDB_G0285347 [Dictyostelium discoideum AX4]Q54NC9.1 RecName: Full=Putative uncharacterized transmembrane protein DDB_G0285347 [Dictyostelium discoideum]EAL64748.1 hypothetical protein DDB_G0285347 [Dictyostelium discoideum AX4]|eukprot:XP_638251.1 hypothetical protein DDB_G0285347 [Dictyostelium discoideum AX4]